VCDHDANGWISFREAEQSLGMDRTLYRGFDADRDGRIQRPEFSQRYLETVELLGTFKPPEPPPAGSELGGGAGLLSLADFDGNAALNEVEFSKLLAGHGFTPDETHQLLLRYDSNVSGELEQGELLEIAARMADGSLAPAEDARVPETLDELFGDPQERPASALGSSLPPRLVGPVTHFRRLDHDADGSVSAGDLLKLLSLIQVDVRAGAVLAFLDRDGNGVLDRQEFEAALE
jgi:Ca2+-binding EF-hand superfamily protein